MAELEKLLQSAYEDKVKGRIPEAVCIELMNKHQTERTGLSGNTATWKPLTGKFGFTINLWATLGRNDFHT